MKLKKFFDSKKGAGASSTFDSIMVVGSVVITGVFIIYFLTQGVELVQYYQHLNPRLTAESMAGLTAALSIVPGDVNLTYNMQSGPESRCKLILWGNKNNIYTGMHLETKTRNRFSELMDLIKNKIPNKCKGKSGKEAKECLKKEKTEDGATLVSALTDLAFGAKCPESEISRLREDIGSWFHNKNKEVKPTNLITALNEVVAGSCRDLIVVSGDKKKGNVVLQLGFKSAVVSAPKPFGISVREREKNRVSCRSGTKFILFKKNNEIGMREPLIG